MFTLFQPLLSRLALQYKLVTVVLTALLFGITFGSVFVIQGDVKDLHQHTIEQNQNIVRLFQQDFVRLLSDSGGEDAASMLPRISSFPSIQKLALYDRNERVIFHYNRDHNDHSDKTIFPAVQSAQEEFTDEGLRLFVPVTQGDHKLGTVYIFSATTGLARNLSTYYKFMWLLIPLLIVVMTGVALYFQRLISKPLHRLTDAVEQVTKDSDYSVRVPAYQEGEIGLLSQGFNQMLNRIQKADAILHEEKERLRVTLESIGEGVITTDERLVVQYMNPMALTRTGWELEELKGKKLEEVFRIYDDRTGASVCTRILQRMHDGGVETIEDHLVLQNRPGHRLNIHASFAPIEGAAGKASGVVIVFRDVSETRRMAQELTYQASHDSLTDLANRHQFEQQLSSILTDAKNTGSEHVLFYLDLDQFKVVNDTCGHMAGDELLRQLARELDDVIRREDTLARLGGDEFGVLLKNCPIKRGLEVAEVLRKRVEDFRFVWEERSFVIGVSIGVVPINEHSETIASVLSAADAACYAAKDSGRNCVHTYEAHDKELAKRQGEMAWVSRLHQALDDDRFELYFQPIARTTGNDRPYLHYEILLRMRDDSGAIIPPGAFLPAAERFNLMPRIDQWVINAVFQWLHQHPDHLDELDMCSINLSGNSLINDKVLVNIVSLARSLNIPAEKICIEVTETAAISNLKMAVRFMNMLRNEGFHIALDDFGCGMSSFAYLKNLPADYLKIDGTFVKDIMDDPIDLAMVKSINDIGHIMGKQTIAEFVENDAIRNKLAAIGVDFSQGYGIARPEPIENLLAPDSDIEKTDRKAS